LQIEDRGYFLPETITHAASVVTWDRISMRGSSTCIIGGIAAARQVALADVAIALTP